VKWAGPLAALAAAVVSLAVVAPTPSYDPLMWLLWGREVLGGELSTTEGPAFKPLPVAICALLAPLGGAAPTAWVLIARAGAAAGAWLAFRLGRRLAGGSVAAGSLAAAGVALCGAYLSYASSGVSEGVLLALALGGAELWRAGRPRAALACGAACALLRVEAWPFLLVAAVVHWRRVPGDRAAVIAAALAVPALWFVPEWLGSGDLLRSGARARVPNPGQPALADVPALASLRDAAELPMWILWAGVAALGVAAWRGGTKGGPAAAARSALLPAAVGAAWIALVAVMAQLGFSGEPRYALPGAALIAVSGAVGLARLARPGVVGTVVGLLVVVAALPKLVDLPDVRLAQAYQRDLSDRLGDAVRMAGGREAVLTCGRPYVGRYRGPLLAYRLDIPKHVVDFEPRAPGAVFASRLWPGSPAEPAAPAQYREVARAGPWRVLEACRIRVP